MSCTVFYPSASSLLIAPETNCQVVTDATLFTGIYTDENVTISPEVDTVEINPMSLFGGMAESRNVTSYARVQTDIKKSIEPYYNTANFLNSDLKKLLDISYLEGFWLYDTDRFKLLTYQNGTTLTITFKANLTAIGAIIAPVDGDIVFNMDTNKLMIYVSATPEWINYVDSVDYDRDIVELEDICKHYINSTKGGLPTVASGVWSDTAKTPFVADDVITIFYADSEPVANLTNDIWVDTSTNNRVTKKYDGTIWKLTKDALEADRYYMGFYYESSTEPKNTATIKAIGATTKATMANVCANFKMMIDTESFVNFTFSLYAPYLEEEGDFKSEIIDIATPEKFISISPLGDTGWALKDNPTKDFSVLNIKSFEFDYGRAIETYKGFEKLTHFSNDFKAVATVVGAEQTNFNAFLSELSAGSVKSLITTIRDDNRVPKVKFFSNRTKTQSHEKKDANKTSEVTKTLSLRPKLNDVDFPYTVKDNRAFSLVFLT